MNVSVGIAVDPPEPSGVFVNRMGVLLAIAVEAVRVANAVVAGKARVGVAPFVSFPFSGTSGVAALEDAQALRKTRPISRVGKITLFFIFTSIDNYISCHIIRLINKGWDEDE